MSTDSKVKVPTRGWYLENRDNGHFKFYTVLITDSGVVVTHWGRIGTAGQAKIEKYPRSQALAMGVKTVHSKMAKGYEAKHEEVMFHLEERDIERACERPDPKSLTLLFDRALRDPKFTGEKDSVVAQYDAFLEKAQSLMDKAASSRFESVMNDFEELEAAWKEIEDKHSLAQTTVNMTKAMLTQALISGKL
jgi:predicted DNA-binding WGR domain protein